MAAVGENAVVRHHIAAAHAGVLLVGADGELIGVEGGLVHFRAALVLHRHAEGAVPDGHILDDGRRGLANADALIRTMMDEAAFDEGIGRALAEVDSVAVESVKRVDERIAHHAIVHHVVVDGVGIGLIVADEGAAVDEARPVANVDEIARDIGMQGAIREGNLAVLGVHRVAVIR